MLQSIHSLKETYQMALKAKRKLKKTSEEKNIFSYKEKFNNHHQIHMQGFEIKGLERLALIKDQVF